MPQEYIELRGARENNLPKELLKAKGSITSAYLNQ